MFLVKKYIFLVKKFFFLLAFIDNSKKKCSMVRRQLFRGPCYKNKNMAQLAYTARFRLELPKPNLRVATSKVIDSSYPLSPNQQGRLLLYNELRGKLTQLTKSELERFFTNPREVNGQQPLTYPVNIKYSGFPFLTTFKHVFEHYTIEYGPIACH